MPGAVRSAAKSAKKRYSQLRPTMGRDSSFMRLRPLTAKMVISWWREPVRWGRVKRALTLSLPGRCSGTGETMTKRV